MNWSTCAAKSLANVWQTDRIARIDPQTGHVTGWVDLTGLLPPGDRRQSVDVLNGIALRSSHRPPLRHRKMVAQAFRDQPDPVMGQPVVDLKIPSA